MKVRKKNKNLLGLRLETMRANTEKIKNTHLQNKIFVKAIVSRESISTAFQLFLECNR